MDVLPVSEPLGKIAPRYPGAVSIKHRFDEQATIRRLTPAVQHIATRLRQYVGSAWSIYRVEDRQNGDLTGIIVNIRKSSYDGEDDVLIIASTVHVLRTRLGAPAS